MFVDVCELDVSASVVLPVCPSPVACSEPCCLKYMRGGPQSFLNMSAVSFQLLAHSLIRCAH